MPRRVGITTTDPSMMSADSMTWTLTRHERVPCTIYSNAKKASQAVAADIAQLIRKRDAEGKKVCKASLRLKSFESG